MEMVRRASAPTCDEKAKMQITEMTHSASPVLCPELLHSEKKSLSLLVSGTVVGTPAFLYLDPPPPIPHSLPQPFTAPPCPLPLFSFQKIPGQIPWPLHSLGTIMDMVL